MCSREVRDRETDGEDGEREEWKHKERQGKIEKEMERQREQEGSRQIGIYLSLKFQG